MRGGREGVGGLSAAVQLALWNGEHCSEAVLPFLYTATSIGRGCKHCAVNSSVTCRPVKWFSTCSVGGLHRSPPTYSCPYCLYAIQPFLCLALPLLVPRPPILRSTEDQDICPGRGR